MSAGNTAAAEIIDETLRERGLDFTRRDENNFVVELPGEKKLQTTCLLTVGKHGVRVEAFVCRHPDENIDGVHRFLLRRNRRLYGGTTRSTGSATSTWSDGSPPRR